MTRFIIFAARLNKDNGIDSQCFLGMPLTDKMGHSQEGAPRCRPLHLPL
ncbi:hypothetical protein SAMN05216403_103116 [Nitrosospira multiformis ATCC 25196]|uniref:Uncharacterized protein n=1 Tax=Nitrosospira multiformis (strain ATCC 25196 / NCIMB 11849 / C 71) TaxID=323848 RepID=A0A1H5SZB3_NITMU|nr:hypothetical protein SAMN05216411_107120 [Nitrosospira multiformis]SEF55258.1 hypothetical protein SAMN05216403_103116 [Nitrosospira multiformis ATCC 25196]